MDGRVNAPVRVLVVEDGQEYTENLARFCADGFVFTRAGDGGAALAALGEEIFDLVFLDMRFDRVQPGVLLGDIAETGALKTVFGERAYEVPVSALKSQVGHLLGGSGGVETIAAIQTIRTGTILPTLNLEHPGEGCDLDYVPLVARQADVRTVVKNSFGFGGQNAVLVLRRYEA